MTPPTKAMLELADKLQTLCCAETEGKFFDCVTDARRDREYEGARMIFSRPMRAIDFAIWMPICAALVVWPYFWMMTK